MNGSTKQERIKPEYPIIVYCWLILKGHLMVKKYTISALLLSFAFLAACGGTPASTTSDEVSGRKVTVEGGEYTEVSIPEFQIMLEEKDFLLVNVHIPLEGSIPNTDTSFPFNEVQQNLDQLPEDKDAKILLYCRSDSMSGVSAEELVALGYTNIWNLDGGYNAWLQAGLPLDIN